MAGAPKPGDWQAFESTKTRNWKAFDIARPSGGRSDLVVMGEVQVAATNQHPDLDKHTLPSGDRRRLQLDLTIVKVRGGGAPIVLYRQIIYVKLASTIRYRQVDIFRGGRLIKQIAVRRITRSGMTAAKKRKKTAAKRKKRR